MSMITCDGCGNYLHACYCLTKTVAAESASQRGDVAIIDWLGRLAAIFDRRASEWDRTATDGNKLAAAECRLFSETLRSNLESLPNAVLSDRP